MAPDSDEEPHITLARASSSASTGVGVSSLPARLSSSSTVPVALNARHIDGHWICHCEWAASELGEPVKFSTHDFYLHCDAGTGAVSGSTGGGAGGGAGGGHGAVTGLVASLPEGDGLAVELQVQWWSDGTSLADGAATLHLASDNLRGLTGEVVQFLADGRALPSGTATLAKADALRAAAAALLPPVRLASQNQPPLQLAAQYDPALDHAAAAWNSDSVDDGGADILAELEEALGHGGVYDALARVAAHVVAGGETFEVDRIGASVISVHAQAITVDCTLLRFFQRSQGEAVAEWWPFRPAPRARGRASAGGGSAGGWGWQRPPAAAEGSEESEGAEEATDRRGRRRDSGGDQAEAEAAPDRAGCRGGAWVGCWAVDRLGR